jgi:hypothetical protein
VQRPARGGRLSDRNAAVARDHLSRMRPHAARGGPAPPHRPRRANTNRMRAGGGGDRRAGLGLLATAARRRQ